MTISRSEGGGGGHGEAAIHVAVAVARDEQGRLRLVRKAGTNTFIQPGGKPEPGETADEALIREIDEELGCAVSAMHPIARYRTMAANEPGRALVADVFSVTLSGEIASGAEIVEARWVRLDEARTLALAPLLSEHILPMLEQA